LIRIAGHERGLHRVHFLRLADTFDRRDLVALMQSGKGKTRKLAPAIDVHRARAALPVIASFFRSGQMQMLSKAIEKSSAGIDAQVVLLAINTKSYRNSIF
jgi:hypothetical protein